VLAMPLTCVIVAVATHALTGLDWTESFLLGALLDRVFASMAAINSFSRTTLMLKGEKDPWQRWNARTGTRALL
jgi:type VI secretion system protein ImpG